MGSSDGKQATMYLLLLVVAILSFSFNEPSNDKVFHLCQYLTILIVLIGWAYMTVVMNEPTESEKEETQEKLDQAISLAGNEVGISQSWWNDIGTYINKILLIVFVWIISGMFHSIYFAYPDSIFEYFSNNLTNYWHYILDNYTEKQIFMFGVFGCEFITYWIVGLFYAFLDLTRPSLITPFKIQQDWVLTWEDFQKAALMGLRNQIIVFLVAWGIYDIYPLVSPNGFSRDLPSIYDFLISMVIYQPFGEIWFYFNHRLLHKYDWTWSHIHYIHHEWTAPIALTCVYAHWFEHLWVNVLTVMLGPFLMGSHVTIWILYSIIAISNTAHAHSGWHLPFMGSSEGHEYHHLTTQDNYGVIGVLDAFFSTNAQYLASWHHEIAGRYTNQEYPVDKILAANGQLSKYSVSNANQLTIKNKSKNKSKNKMVTKETNRRSKSIGINTTRSKKCDCNDNNNKSESSESDCDSNVAVRGGMERKRKGKRKRKSVQIRIGDAAVDSLKLKRQMKSKSKSKKKRREREKEKEKEQNEIQLTKKRKKSRKSTKSKRKEGKEMNKKNEKDDFVSDMEICDSENEKDVSNDCDFQTIVVPWIEN